MDPPEQPMTSAWVNFQRLTPEGQISNKGHSCLSLDPPYKPFFSSAFPSTLIPADVSRTFLSNSLCRNFPSFSQRSKRGHRFLEESVSPQFHFPIFHMKIFFMLFYISLNIISRPTLFCSVDLSICLPSTHP